MQRFINAIKYFLRKVSASRVNAYSAQTAYFMFLSLIPLIMMLFSLLQIFGDAGETLTDTISKILPGILGEFINEYVIEIITDGRLTPTIISAILLLWSSSRGVFSIIGGLNSVYEIKETRKYLWVRFLSVLYTLAFIIIVCGVLLIIVFGDTLIELSNSFFPNLKGLVYIISSLRFIIGFIILVLFFSIVYKSLPSRKMKFIDQIPGAVIAGAGWVSFSILFSFYVDNFSNYANVYGSLTAIIVLMLWLYTCMYIMFIGAEINFILSSKVNEEKHN
jgi:membrane protein